MNMTLPDVESADYRQRIDEYVAAQVASARKQEILTIYAELLDGIWQRIIPTLGRMTVVAIVERALRVSARQHRILLHVVVTRDNGIDLGPVREHTLVIPRDELHGAFKDLIVNIVDLLVMLTGDLLVRHVVADIDTGDSTR